MKNTLLLLGSFFFVLTIDVGAKNYLSINDGSHGTRFFDLLPTEIRFDENLDLKILSKADGTERLYPFSTSLEIRFENKPNNVEQVRESVDVRCWVKDDCLWIKTDESLRSQQLKVYSLSGRLVISTRYNPDHSVSVSHLPKGFYILTIEGRKIKFVR